MALNQLKEINGVETMALRQSMALINAIEKIIDVETMA